MLQGVTTSNGLAWSADDRTMYYIDSGTQGIDAFDFDAAIGAVSNRRRLVTIDPSVGEPDGMTIDRDGCLWIALWGGSAVHRYSPDGQLDRVVPVPTRLVTSCTFGGDRLRDLFITTAKHNFAGGELDNHPDAGRVFRYRPGVSGFAAERYAG
jgi:sugar lactone lactonase YvrE